MQSYFAAYEQAKRDIEIEEQKAVRLRVEQLGNLKKKVQKVGRPINQSDKPSLSGGVCGQALPYQPHPRPTQF